MVASKQTKATKRAITEEPKPKRKTKPKIEIDLQTVENLARRGLTNEQIALALGICEKTLYSRKRESTEFTDAIKRGQAKGIMSISNALYETAKKGNVTAMIFFLKSRAGWKETDIHEHTGKDGGPIDVSVKPDIKQLSTDQLLEIYRMNENKRNTMDSGGDS